MTLSLSFSLFPSSSPIHVIANGAFALSLSLSLSPSLSSIHVIGKVPLQCQLNAVDFVHASMQQSLRIHVMAVAIDLTDIIQNLHL